VREPALSRSTVDRCSDSRNDADWLRGAWVGGQLLLLDAQLNTSVTSAGRPALIWEATAGDEPPVDAVLLGADEVGTYWALDVPELEAPAGGPRVANLREVGQQLSSRDSGLFTHAVAVLTWHRAHQHCPRCGAPTTPVQAGAVRLCSIDGSEHFPRVDPAMIVLITSPDGSHAVLGRTPAWPEKFYSCLAGFVEPGESAERAVIREVAEEVGLVVREVVYSASQPWPFPSSLMLGFRATAELGELRPQPGELAAAEWFTREEVVAGLESGELGLPPGVSIARGLIDDWLAD
jgi:NAD+ diphosphatase